jgi:hypothetical protein
VLASPVTTRRVFYHVLFHGEMGNCPENAVSVTTFPENQEALMIGDEWVEKVKQYRLAVDAYGDAVDRMDGTRDLGKEWQRTEVAREAAEQARVALLKHTRKPLFARIQSMVFDEAPDHGTEELVLGDLGQHGG